MNRSGRAIRIFKSCKGYTLIELLIVIALMAIISIPVSASLIFGVKVFNSETDVDTVFQDQQSAFTEIKERLRLDPYHVQVVSNEGVTELQIGNLEASRTAYYLTSGNLMRRIGTKTPQILCHYVTTFDLSHLKFDDKDRLTEIKIKLTAVINNREHILESDFSLRRY